MSNKTSNIGVTTKLGSLLMVCAVIPLMVIGASVFIEFQEIKDQAGNTFQVSAETIADKIDRNLFERYGDVQAFGMNRVIHNESDWYKGGTENPLIDTMNQYVTTYGIYNLTILVDLKGKVIAVNSKDAGGNPINVSSIYGKNFIHEVPVMFW